MNSNFIDLTHEVEAHYTIDVWRKEINPFTIFGFLKDSKFEKQFDGLPSERSGTDKSNAGVQTAAEERSPQKEDEEEEFSIKSNNQSYHVEFFHLIIQKIKRQKKAFDVCFDEAEKKIFETFEELSADCQELYVRLFQRKHAWIREEKVKYDNINCTTCLRILVDKGDNFFCERIHKTTSSGFSKHFYTVRGLL